MRFIEQDRKLEVDNIDTTVLSDGKSRHGLLFPDTIRALIIGPSGCGKTNLVFTLLTHENGVKFENVYIYSKTLYQPKYVMLDEILNGSDSATLFKFHDDDTILAPEEVLPNSVFIFDDIICENQNIVRAYFSRGRHNGINVFYLAQSYSRVPKQLIRDNANFIVLFKQDDMNLKHIYEDHCSADVTYSEFKDFCIKCWQRGKFEFVVISKEDELDNGRYRFGFDMFVII